ncbi:hypothetical protein PF005_g10883 [Phytophthora fragariae]|uniref:Ion transport domain-containing protein n=1 Tax=Phytophthora fragariae TaxID=53985 RepID=A0A6A3TZM9_9STRA|nr:hypothetical protein PF006_g10419 [Phytophthora fragariae]KAE9211742.1 hypothetical protein PF005_g10883 [Phytophthora fragariae]
MAAYGTLPPPRDGLMQHLASQATHVDSLQTLSRKLERNTFAPVVCSILGVVVFMRLGVVVGTLGVYYAVLVISAAFVVTFLTVMSMSALASTGDGVAQAGGGLFNALRHSLGHRLGHMIGLMLYISFGMSAAFYLLEFSELAMVVVGVQDSKIYPLPWNEDGSAVTVAVASAILAGLMYGVQVRITLRALRLAFVLVMVAVACNLLFLSVPNASKRTVMSMAHFRENSVEHTPKMFRRMFATFFPGFCGVIAGANLAEYVSERTAARASTAVVRKASQYFLLGVHKALAFSFLVYVGLGFVLAACVRNKVLEKEPFVVPLVVDSVLGVPLIFLGVASTTLSSALSSIKGASTIFTTLYAQPPQLDASELSSMTKEIVPANECLRSPRNFPVERNPSVLALMCTWILCQTAILCGTVDALIPVDLSSATFHPSFRMYSKWTAFMGCVLSLSAFFLVVSTLFLSVATVLLLGYTAIYRRGFTQFVDELRLPDHDGRPTLHRQDVIYEQILVDEAMAPLGSSSPGPSRPQREADAKRIELAALYVRDAIHGRFLGEEYLVDGMNRMQYKQLFHGLWYIRTANMCVLMALAFFETPSWCFFLSSCGDYSEVLTWDLPVLPQNISIAIELACLTFLALELSMKYKYMGSRVYFVDKWHILQIVFVLADFVAVVTLLITPEDTSVENFQSDKNDPGTNASKPIVLAPLIRPFIMITMSHRLRAGFSSLLRALPRFADGLITLIFLIVLYAVLGMVLFVGSTEAGTYFKSFDDTCMSLIILLTTANFPDVMMPIYSQARVYSLFFISFLMIGQLLVMNLVFASIYQHYRQEIAERAVGYSAKRKLALQAAFHLLPTERVIFEEDASSYFSSPKNIYDCTVTLVIFVAEVSVHTHSSEVEWQWIRLLLLFRFLRCLRLLVALQALSSMFAIVVRLIPAFLTLYGMLGMLMYAYAAVGMQLFGGKLVVGDPRLAGITYGQANFYSNNFNDFASSLTTLFELLIVNNWFVTMEGAVTVTSKWSRIYFVSFYVVGVVMVLSLVVAFVVEAYFEDAARSESPSTSSKSDTSEDDSDPNTMDFTTREPNDPNGRAQRLLRTRSSTLRMRPRADSIYVEEFL